MLFRSADVTLTSAQDELAESIFESSDLLRERGSARVRSVRASAANLLVVAPDTMVAGVAGGDHKTAARRAVMYSATDP